MSDNTESIGKRQLRDYQFYGMWNDKTDIADSAEWVRKHRENWNERLKRNQIESRQNDETY